MPLPSIERILLGPGPSQIAPRVMRAMAAPVLGHLDPDFVPLLDEVRASLQRLFRADAGALTIATSGTGTSAMEAAVANAVREGTRGTVVVTGYFGDRLVQMFERYGARVRRIDVEWGRAADPQRLRDELRRHGADVVGMVHAETSTGVLNPIKELAAVAREHGALTIVDTVTSLGGHEVDVEGWGVDIAYSCSQKCIGAPSGMSPIAVAGPARARLVPCRSFYVDLKLLEDYWVGRKYHHTLSTTLIYALREALLMIEEEGLPARHARHERHHLALAAGLEAMGLSLLPPEGERLWTLNAICVPDGVDEAAVRRTLLTAFNLEVGAGLGPLAGKIWRVGLMGASSTAQNVLQFLAVLEHALALHGFGAREGDGVAAASAVLRPELSRELQPI
ncbi:MAG TPA: alanine--glyoxylate aminotransferase family protein [Vicinamibacterales bacterium]|nr:alanine--glyoxylate aminotransferase family protein [Vicinamibacterales bacterium]